MRQRGTACHDGADMAGGSLVVFRSDLITIAVEQIEDFCGQNGTSRVAVPDLSCGAVQSAILPDGRHVRSDAGRFRGNGFGVRGVERDHSIVGAGRLRLPGGCRRRVSNRCDID